MTPAEARDVVNRPTGSFADVLHELMDSGPIRVAIIAFFVGVAWAALRQIDAQAGNTLPSALQRSILALSQGATTP